MATLALTNAELYSEVGRMLGISRTYTDWDAVTLADVNRIIRSGRRRFFSANNWKFLVQDLAITVAAPITTGTVTIVSGVVTFVGAAALPASLVSDYLFAPEGGGVFSIATRTDDTNCILTDTDDEHDAAALTTFKLYQVKYDLPSTFGGWEGPISLENYTGHRLNESRNFPDYVLRAFAGRHNARTGKPEIFAVTTSTDEETAIATKQLSIYPLPDQMYILNTQYKIMAGDTLGGLVTAVASDPVFSECYKESVLAAGEVIAFGQPGAHTMRFQELLVEAVRQDNAMSGVRYGRPRRSTYGRSRYYDLIVGTVDMSDMI
jgi:hypothetical protein